ncbi:toxin co-regulated pilus biosynthesis Q family protein, partial [Bordetella pertussis]
RRPRPRQPPSRPPPPRFRAAPPDLTLRAVLARWARAAGWTFEAEHWALDVDIPLAGKAELPGDFKTAVRALLAATELSERPAQPCFYANRVLRVVPLAQACDRTRAAAPGLT